MKRIYTMIIGLAIVGGLLMGVVSNVFSATISFNLEIAKSRSNDFQIGKYFAGNNNTNYRFFGNYR